MPHRSPARSVVAAALMSLMGLAAPPAQAQSTTILALPAPFGSVWLGMPDAAFGASPRGVVIVLPDATGHDGRAEPYIGALHGMGLATLEVALDADTAAGPGVLAASVTAARQVLAADPRLAEAQVGLLGFGAGAAAALGWAGALPVAALYPRCASVEAAPAAPAASAQDGAQAPLLLLHPERDATDREGACLRLSQAIGVLVFRHAYPDTTPGWDIPPMGSIAGPTLQPREADAAARYRAEFRAAVVHDAARRVAWFMAAAAERRGPWQPPAPRP